MINQELVQYYDTNVRSSQNIRKVRDCGMVLMNRDLNHVLLIHQRESQKWGFPKGHMTMREIERKDYFQCAKRELFEETGIILSTNKYTRLGKVIINNKLFYIVCIHKDHIYAKPIDVNEIDDARWMDVNQLGMFVRNYPCNRTLKEFVQLCEQAYIKTMRANGRPPPPGFNSLPMYDPPLPQRLLPIDYSPSAPQGVTV